MAKPSLTFCIFLVAIIGGLGVGGGVASAQAIASASGGVIGGTEEFSLYGPSVTGNGGSVGGSRGSNYGGAIASVGGGTIGGGSSSGSVFGGPIGSVGGSAKASSTASGQDASISGMPVNENSYGWLPDGGMSGCVGADASILGTGHSLGDIPHGFADTIIGA